MVRKIVALIFSFAVLLCAQASAQTVDELIKKNVEARGGLEKLKAVKSLRLTGKILTDGLQTESHFSSQRAGKATRR
jgi:hypothetical protein